MKKKLTREDIDQEVFDLYDDYAHNKLERRQFIEKLSTYAVGGLTLPTLMSFRMRLQGSLTAFVTNYSKA